MPTADGELREWAAAGRAVIRNPKSAIRNPFPHIKRPTSGASVSMRRSSSSLASERRNRAGAASARVGSRASLRQEKTSASWLVLEKAALHKRPVESENNRSLPDGRGGALREVGRGMLLWTKVPVERAGGDVISQGAK